MWKYLPIEKPTDGQAIWVVLNSIYSGAFKANYVYANPDYVVNENGLQYWSYEVVKWKAQ